MVVSTKGSLSEELGEEADSVVLIDDLPVFSFIEADSSWDVRSHNVEKVFADVC